jgi:hypothetical protein
MWGSVLLNETFGRSLVKSAILTGDINLIRPESEYEREQIEDVTKEINRSKSHEAALTFALLADTVYIDTTHFSWEIFTNPDLESDDLSTRSIIEAATAEFSAFVKPTDSSRNAIPTRVRIYKSDPQPRANLYASLEPLIWWSFQRSKSKPSRKTLRDLLDLIVLQPELIKKKGDDDPKEFHEILTAAARQKWPHINLFEEQKSDIGHLLYRTIVKGQVVADAMEEAQRLNAIYPVKGLSFGQNRYHGEQSFPGGSSQDMVVAVRIFLDEIKYWPKLNDFSDILRLREHKHFVEFRDILRQWVKAVTEGDKKAEAQLRHEIQRANIALSTSMKCVNAGRFFTYLGLPTLILDVLFAPVLGTLFTVTGFALQAFSDWQKRQHKWLIVGE